MSEHQINSSSEVSTAQDGASRRDFLKIGASVSASAGAFSMAFFVPERASAADPKGMTPANNDPQKINAWIEIRPDETVIIRYARSEMGQGSRTSAPMLIAEELEVDWKKVKVEYALAHDNLKQKRVYGDMASVGSRTIRLSQEYLRKAGATAREMLIVAGSQAMNVPSSECIAKLGMVIHPGSKKSISYGKVALKAAELTPPANVSLKDPKDWTIAGKSSAWTSQTLSRPEFVMAWTHSCLACKTAEALSRS